MRRRNAQGLSVQTLIMVALGILVLIMAIVFYDSIVDDSRSTVNSCTNLGGQCSSTPCAQQGQLENRLGDCGEGQYCCVNRGQNT